MFSYTLNWFPNPFNKRCSIDRSVRMDRRSGTLSPRKKPKRQKEYRSVPRKEIYQLPVSSLAVPNFRADDGPDFLFCLFHDGIRDQQRPVSDRGATGKPGDQYPLPPTSECPIVSSPPGMDRGPADSLLLEQDAVILDERPKQILRYYSYCY